MTIRIENDRIPRFFFFLRPAPLNSYPAHRPARNPAPRRPPALGAFLRVCPGGRHAWFDSPAGPVRKPYDAATQETA